MIFLGQLDRQRLLPTLYASADAFVFASLTETLGLVVLEAMASGLPVIAAPAGSGSSPRAPRRSYDSYGRGITAPPQRVQREDGSKSGCSPP